MLSPDRTPRFSVVHHGELGATAQGGRLYASVPMALARGERLTHAARSVALYVWSHDEKHQQSAAAVAEALGTTRKTVRDGLSSLQEHGWLVRQPHIRPGNKRQSFEVWHLQMTNTPFSPELVRRLSEPVELSTEGEQKLPRGVDRNDAPPCIETAHQSSTSSSAREVHYIGVDSNEVGRNDPPSGDGSEGSPATAEDGLTVTGSGSIEFDPFKNIEQYRGPRGAAPSVDGLKESPATASDVSASSTVTAEGSAATAGNSVRHFWAECPDAPDLSNLGSVPTRFRPSPEKVAGLLRAIRFVLDECQGMDLEETAAALADAGLVSSSGAARRELDSGTLSGYVMPVTLEG